MGFMSKLKHMKNFVTGGHAKVSIEIIDPCVDDEFTIKLKAITNDAPVKIAKVYLQIKGVETVKIPNVTVSKEYTEVHEDTEYDEVVAETDIETTSRNITKTSKTAFFEVVVAQSQELEANKEYNWEATVKLPDDALSTYDGILAKHNWMALGGLDVTGNDPDSGWIKFEAY